MRHGMWLGVVAAGLLVLGGRGPVAAWENPAYGRYCGFGNFDRASEPVDALDAACKRHDACVGQDIIARCSCHSRFTREAGAIARDRRRPEGERSMAGQLEKTVSELPCVGAR